MVKYDLKRVSCHSLQNLFNQTSIQINGTIYHMTNRLQLMGDLQIFNNLTEKCGHNPSWIESAYLTINLTRIVVGPTHLKQNQIYYNTYCIGINTIFASLLPFLALMFLNISIALELRSKKVTIGFRFSAFGFRLSVFDFRPCFPKNF